MDAQSRPDNAEPTLFSAIITPHRSLSATGFTVVMALVATGFQLSAWAETTRKDVLVMARMISFLSTRPTGPVSIAIVYAPARAESKHDADGLVATLGSGLTVGPLTLVPVLVPVDQLQQMDGATAALVTAGLDDDLDAIFRATAARKLVSLSTDFNCVRTARCVVSVRSEPKVDIVVNRAAAEQSSVTFVAAVRLMITEI